ncbi:MAG: hypothetical protein DME46_03405 [Verrucomicrobia bacterium]|nr:MAG: hypothetical protein DME46_03405 [Verrucomicrobiota bacterium]
MIAIAVARKDVLRAIEFICGLLDEISIRWRKSYRRLFAKPARSGRASFRRPRPRTSPRRFEWLES